jgi:hypothetical protein
MTRGRIREHHGIASPERRGCEGADALLIH